MSDQQSSTSGIIAQGRAIFRAQADDQRRVIPYRPQYNLFTGSPTASVLLQQIVYWWEISGRKPFYKFREPCTHDRYKEGDSWSEELGFTPSIFDGALKRIGKKITKGVSKAKAQREHIVTYWTDSSRVTWYQVNEALLAIYVYLAYNDPDFLGKSEKLIYLDESGKPFYLGKAGKLIYLSSEITQETTTERESALPTDDPTEKRYQAEIQETERSSNGHAALDVYIEETGEKLPSRSWCQAIEQAVADVPNGLTLWRRTVHAWIGMGWRKNNLVGMLECFTEGRIPGKDRNESDDGGTSANASAYVVGPGFYETPDWLIPKEELTA